MSGDFVTRCSRQPEFLWPWQARVLHFNNNLWFFDRYPDVEKPCPKHGPQVDYECEMHREGCWTVSLREGITRQSQDGVSYHPSDDVLQYPQEEITRRSGATGGGAR